MCRRYNRPVATIRQDMDDLAAQTLSRILLGDERGIRLREDTITEANLLDLDLRQRDLVVHRFNQNEERAVGADWEWFIGSDIAGWFGLRIQAKRADGGQYRQLGHPGLGTDDYQYDTLIQSCATAASPNREFKFFPHYVFFNGLETWPPSAVWSGCPNEAPIGACSHAELNDFGCSTAPAQLVKRIHGGQGIEGRRIESHLSVHVPWSWLFGFLDDSSVSVSDPSGSSDASNLTTHAVLAWHQAQERTLAAIATLDALAAGSADGDRPSEEDEDAAGQFGTDDLVRGFWQHVIAEADVDVDTSDLSAEAPPYAAYIRARAQRRDEGDFELGAEQPVLFDPGLPKRILIVDLGPFDG